MRRARLTGMTITALALAAIGLPALSQAADGTGVYGSWAVSGGSGQLTFTGTVFPNATITSTDGSLSVARSATLTSATPFGAQYGTSSGRTYLSSAIASGKPAGAVTVTFDEPPVPGTWGMAFGDVDAENLVITGSLADGTSVDISEWGIETFNYAGQSDVPTYDPTTGRLVGSGVDTSGATVWLAPSQSVTSVTIVQERASGFPQYQLWIAADVIAAAGAAPSPTSTATAIPAAPTGKVTICHATSSVRNPYVEVTVSTSAVTRKQGHGSHMGGVYPVAGWGDIIPPFDGFPGLNWPAGASILANNCETGDEQLNYLATPSASPSATPSASPSATPTAEASASASVTASATPSASPSASATDSASPSASASAAPSPSSQVTVDPGEPVVVVTDPERPIAITVEPAAEIIDAVPPRGGQVVVTEDAVTFTPEPGTSGRQEIVVTYVDRAGEVKTATVVVEVRPMAATSVLPVSLRLGANVVDARARVTATCQPLFRAKGFGDVRLCSTNVRDGRTVVSVNAPARVTLSVTRSSSDGSVRLLESRTYTVRR